VRAVFSSLKSSGVSKDFSAVRISSIVMDSDADAKDILGIAGYFE
jgi:hypothetical protein